MTKAINLMSRIILVKKQPASFVEEELLGLDSVADIQIRVQGGHAYTFPTTKIYFNSL